MTISSQLSELMQIKSDLKSVLLSKGVITDSTPFSEYPVACSDLQVLPESVILTITFKPKSYTTSTTNVIYVANYRSTSNSSRQGYIKVNGVNYYNLVYGLIYSRRGTVNDISCNIEIPYGTEEVNIEAFLTLGENKDSARMKPYYTSDGSPATATIYNMKEDTTVVFSETGPWAYF